MQVLDLSNCENIGDASCTQIASLCPGIREVLLNNTSITWATMSSLMNSNVPLETLDVSRNMCVFYPTDLHGVSAGLGIGAFLNPTEATIP